MSKSITPIKEWEEVIFPFILEMKKEGLSFTEVAMKLKSRKYNFSPEYIRKKFNAIKKRIGPTTISISEKPNNKKIEKIPFVGSFDADEIRNKVNELDGLFEQKQDAENNIVHYQSEIKKICSKIEQLKEDISSAVLSCNTSEE